VHRLVCEAFEGLPPSPDHEVRHLDGDRLNNHATNLRWGTRQENVRDTIRHGRAWSQDPNRDIRRGSRIGTAKLTEADVVEIRAMRSGGATMASIGLRFGVSRTCIGHVIGGKTWRTA
jgi:hypothetical protein